MRRLLAAWAALVVLIALVVLAPAPARADGAAFGSIRQAPQGAESDVRTPDQRALLRWDPDTRTETLVVIPRGFVCDVTVDSPRHVVVVRPDLDLRTAAPDRFDFDLDEGVPLRGRVTDAEGRPLADAEVRVPDRVNAAESRSVPVAPDGTFEIPGNAPDVGPVEVTVHVHRAGVRCPSEPFPLTPGAPRTDLVVRLVPSPTTSPR